MVSNVNKSRGADEVCFDKIQSLQWEGAAEILSNVNKSYNMIQQTINFNVKHVYCKG